MIQSIIQYDTKNMLQGIIQYTTKYNAIKYKV